MAEEWEKTVLTDAIICQIIDKKIDMDEDCNYENDGVVIQTLNVHPIVKAQAKATWEVAYQAGEQAGIREGRQEVVKFVIAFIFPLLDSGSVPVCFKDKWNEKLKEWLE